MVRFAHDWTGKYSATPLAVARPATTQEVSDTLKFAARHAVPVVPVSGNTGLVGGTMTKDGLMISLDRMNRIRALNPAARTAIVEAGVILTTLHEAAADLTSLGGISVLTLFAVIAFVTVKAPPACSVAPSVIVSVPALEPS